MKPEFCLQCGKPLEKTRIDGKERPACTSKNCSYVYWDNPVPVVGAIVEWKGQVILIRNKGWPEELFGIVTGLLEKGESPEAGVLREVKEELGLDGNIEELVGLYSFFEMNQLILVYHITADGDIVTGEELAAWKGIEPDRLRPKPSGTGYALIDWLKTRKNAAGKK